MRPVRSTQRAFSGSLEEYATCSTRAHASLPNFSAIFFQASIPLELDFTNIAPGTKSMYILINSTSAGDDLNLEDNSYNLTIPLITEADIAVTGYVFW